MKMGNIIIGVVVAVILIFGGGTGGYFVGRASVKPEQITNTVILNIDNYQTMNSEMNVDNNMIQSTSVYGNVVVLTNRLTNTVTNWTRSSNWITKTN